MGLAPGDKVVATRDGGRDPSGEPRQRPKRGQTYVITSIYPMKYGYGCTLEGLDPTPYKGYFLLVDHPKLRKKMRGIYFKKADQTLPERLALAEAAVEQLTAGASSASVLCCAPLPSGGDSAHTKARP